MNSKIRSPGYVIELARKMRLNLIAIEIDGDIHKFREEYDEYRDNFLKSIGRAILRFTNDDVIQNINYVVADIKKNLIL